jgi:nucleoside-triphosphatase THEP1
MEENIYILSEPIRSGKTTALLEFCNQQLSVGGVITPDVNGIRKIYYPREKKYADLQIENEKEGITVGKFNFSNDAFSNARSVLQELDFDEYSWIIVDEIGKLELLSANGFEPELSKLIKRFKDYNGDTKLLLVIRDSLLQLGRGFYDLKFAKVISIADLKLIQAKSTIPENLLGALGLSILNINPETRYGNLEICSTDNKEGKTEHFLRYRAASYLRGIKSGKVEAIESMITNGSEFFGLAIDAMCVNKEIKKWLLS